MSISHRIEIDRNYDFFQRSLKSLLDEHLGEFVLLRAEAIVDFFSKPGEAYRAGLAKFPDELFSIQEVREDPIELGHFAFDPR